MKDLRFVLWIAVVFLTGAALMWAAGLQEAAPPDEAATSPPSASDLGAGSRQLASASPGGTSPDAPSAKSAEKRAEPAASSDTPAPPKEPVEKRIVPVVSLGDGARIGAVQIAGPRSYVETVKAVVQLEGDYKGVVRYRALIPIKAEKVIEKIERVPFVAVTGIVDLKVS
jgi:hypothetical protein